MTVERNQPAPEEIIARAVAYKPVATYVGFSGGNDSRHVAHWMMNNVPGCEVFHINTGIGIERTREYVRDTCKEQGWPLHEIRAKEDCGQDYDALVRRGGFPGPDAHGLMYSLLKERAVRLLVRRAKVNHGRNANVMLATGVRYDNSVRRMRYVGQEIRKAGGQLWVNPHYWTTAEERDAYNAVSGIPENPVSRELGMSGECCCGAYAQPGERELIRKVCPATGARIDRLEQEVLAAGFTWSWEGRPPKGGFNPSQESLFRPLCFGCEKSAIVQQELAEFAPQAPGLVMTQDRAQAK